MSQESPLLVHDHQLPVSQPRCPVHNYARDGQIRFGNNDGSNVNYEPNSFGGPVEDMSVKEPPLKISGDAIAMTTAPATTTTPSPATCSD